MPRPPDPREFFGLDIAVEEMGHLAIVNTEAIKLACQQTVCSLLKRRWLVPRYAANEGCAG